MESEFTIYIWNLYFRNQQIASIPIIHPPCINIYPKARASQIIETFTLMNSVFLDPGHPKKLSKLIPSFQNAFCKAQWKRIKKQSPNKTLKRVTLDASWYQNRECRPIKNVDTSKCISEVHSKNIDRSRKFRAPSTWNTRTNPETQTPHPKSQESASSKINWTPMFEGIRDQSLCITFL